MDVSTLSQSLFLRNTIRKLQSDMLHAEWQQASGKKAKTFSGIAGQSSMLLSLRNRVQGIVQYQVSIGTTLTRTSVMQDALGYVASSAGTISEFALSSKDINPQMLARLPSQARTSLDQSIAMLNASVGDRYLFAGNKPSAPPVAEAADILGGSGVAPLGLHDLVKDRLWADLGDDGNGWIHADVTTNANEIVLMKDTNWAPVVPPATPPQAPDDFKEFGFALHEITLMHAGSASYGVRDSGTYGGEIVATNPGYDVRNTASLTLSLDPTQLEDGDTITIELGMPEPAEPIQITLSFTTDATKASDRDDVMVIDPTLTNGLILGRLNKLIETAAKEKLAPASAQRAADLMFDYQVDPAANDANPVPRYVAKDPITGRPQLKYDNGPSQQVMRWYSGQTWPQNTAEGLRDSAQAVIDHNVTIAYGVRADEPSIRDAIKHLALMTLPTSLFDADIDDDANEGYTGYKKLVGDSGLALNGYQTGVIAIQADIGLKEQRLNDLQTRHEQTFTVVSKQILDIEAADPFDVASRLLEYETRLKATYEISGRIHALSIVNFLR